MIGDTPAKMLNHYTVVKNADPTQCMAGIKELFNPDIFRSKGQITLPHGLYVSSIKEESDRREGKGRRCYLGDVLECPLVI